MTEEEQGGVYEGQCNDSLEARCHSDDLSRALAGAWIMVSRKACARQRIRLLDAVVERWKVDFPALGGRSKVVI